MLSGYEWKSFTTFEETFVFWFSLVLFLERGVILESVVMAFSL